MINVEIIKVHARQILPCGRVTGNKEFTIGDLIEALHKNQPNKSKVALYKSFSSVCQLFETVACT